MKRYRLLYRRWVTGPLGGQTKSFRDDFEASGLRAAEVEAQVRWEQLEKRGYTLLEPETPALIELHS